MPLLSLSSRVPSDFVVDLYSGLPSFNSWTSWDLTGEASNHFPEANPPNTVTLAWQLAVLAAKRRSIEVRIVMLHRFAVAGTSSGPKRESSPGTVSWLLRYHFLG